MSSATSAGPPSIRTDWLADVAWRLASFGPQRWRATDAESFVIEDHLDGGAWTLSPALWSPATEAVVEFDGDLLLPTDADGPQLRIGGSIAAVCDNDRGRALAVRIEIGPRGPVTFDPENWMYVFPLDVLEAGERPGVEGLEAGEIELRGAGQRPGGALVAGKADALADAGAVWLGDLVEVAEGRRSWQTVIPVSREARGRRRGLLGPRAAPLAFAALQLTADGELRVEPAAALVSHALPEIQPTTGIKIERERVVIAVPASAIPGGEVTVAGPGLRAEVLLVASDARVAKRGG